MMAIVCGGRDYTDRARVKRVLDAAVERMGLWCIIEGEGTGADALALEWARARPDISVIAVPADWDGWAAKGRREAAGPVRNSLMLDILLGGDGPRAVIAFPSSGPGTKNMLALANSRKAREKGVKVIMA